MFSDWREKMKNTIEVSTTVNVDIEKVWKLWNSPGHIVNWYFATDEWHCPHAESQFKEGGQFSYRMEAKDKSFGFDFSGKFTQIINFEKISYTLEDNRITDITFVKSNGGIIITEIFESENSSTIDMQKAGWQSILENFKKYAEEYQ